MAGQTELYTLMNVDTSIDLSSQLKKFQACNIKHCESAYH